MHEHSGEEEPELPGSCAVLWGVCCQDCLQRNGQGMAYAAFQELRRGLEDADFALESGDQIDAVK